ncbi:MAG: arginine--tRNA ligase, partial [Clostridiales bacterium]|nr:arginine--tRNA ligase [Clostridiales bacterium]
MDEKTTVNFKKSLAEILAAQTHQPQTEIEIAIETPPDSKLGHFAFPCFILAKTLKKSPQAIASELAKKIEGTRPYWLGQAVATGPYLNFFLNRTSFVNDVLHDVLEAGAEYGTCDNISEQSIIVEYSSPNIAKHFHIGHLGTTIIGKSLDNIFRFLGHEVTSINHLGDWGTQFGKLITAYKKWGDKDDIAKTEIDGLVKLYVKFHEEADNDPSLNDEARAWVVKMQDGDKESLEIWKWFCELSMYEFERIYERLDISFDLIRGESYYSDKMEAVADALEKKGLLKESDG